MIMTIAAKTPRRFLLFLSMWSGCAQSTRDVTVLELNRRGRSDINPRYRINAEVHDRYHGADEAAIGSVAQGFASLAEIFGAPGGTCTLPESRFTDNFAPPSLSSAG